jgi:hypothetical protein
MRKVAVGSITSVITMALLQAGCAPPGSQLAGDPSARSALPTATAPPAATADGAANPRNPRHHPRRSRHANHHRHAAVGSTSTAQARPWCAAAAYYNAQDESNVHVVVSVSSNQPYQTVTATTTSGESQNGSTSANGHADVDIHVYADEGDIAISVRVGDAACSTNA